MYQFDIERLANIIQKGDDNIAGIVVLQDGVKQYERYFHGCTADSRIHVYSVTKSIVSILIGIAMDQGFLKSLDQKVLDFFPAYPVKPREKALQTITLRHLLTMTAPYRWRWNPYVRYFTSDDWVTFALDTLGGKGQVGTFQYAPLIGPDILSGILVQVTGQSVLDFAQTHLFLPLGITVEKGITFQSKEEQLAFNRATNISGWVADLQGIHAAGWGLTLSAMDMTKIGQLYLQNGVWNGKQIVSADWVHSSTQEQSRWKKANLPYGYLWWICDHGFAAMGDGGNIIYGNTQKKLVVSIASLFKPKARDRIALIEKNILPLFPD